MKQIRYIIILIVFVLTTSFNFQTKYDRSNLSAVILKIKYSSYGIKGFGGKLKIRNIESNEIFESKSKKGFNPYVIIENLPECKYFIEEIEIISGPTLLII